MGGGCNKKKQTAEQENKQKILGVDIAHQAVVNGNWKEICKRLMTFKHKNGTAEVEESQGSQLAQQCVQLQRDYFDLLNAIRHALDFMKLLNYRNTRSANHHHGNRFLGQSNSNNHLICIFIPQLLCLYDCYQLYPRVRSSFQSRSNKSMGGGSRWCG